MAPHPTHRPDRLSSKNECGRGDVSQPNARDQGHVKPRAGASSEFDRASLPLGAIDKPAVAFLPATAGDLTSIGAGAGKIADWSIAGRIGEGQPVPRFGSVARSPLTGRGSDGRPVQFSVWGVLSSALRYITRARALGFYAVAPVPSHGANERLGQFLDTADVLRGARAASLPVVKFVRARLAGLPGLARIAVQRGARIAVRVSEQVQLLCVGSLSHGSERIHEVSHASERTSRERGIFTQGGGRV